MASVYYDGSISEGAISAASIAANSVTGYAVGGYTGIVSGSISKGGKPVASKDDVVKAIYRLNPTLKVEFKDEEEFVEALIAAGNAAHQERSRNRLRDAELNLG